ncbi:hypothetical protein R1flu_008320 [Riccia fluitans]|uniref:Uncharacterized protein n=1 Tax=Riccia fluitans TaxID=41844 RepID=A0ABD1YBK7_9MARC
MEANQRLGFPLECPAFASIGERFANGGEVAARARHEMWPSPLLAKLSPVEANALPSLLLFPDLAAANMDLNRPFWRSNDLGYLQLGQGQNVVPETPEVYLNLHDLGSTQTSDFGGAEDPMQNDQPPHESVPCHPVLKNNWKKWIRAVNPTWNGKSTQVRKSFIFFASLELHGIKIDWSTMNVHKGINRYSTEEKEKARKELWRMQVKFEGELCEPIDPDKRKRRRTSGSRTSNKHSRKSENMESGKRAEHTEAAASGQDGPDQVPVDQGRIHMPYGDAPADPSPAVDKCKAKVDEGPKKPNEKNLQK